MHANVKQNVVPLITPGLKVACSQCNLRELCLPFGLDDRDMARLDSLIGGGALWVLKGHKPEEYKGVAAFLAHLASPDQQAKWHKDTGYMPITKAAYEKVKAEGYYDKYPQQEVAITQVQRGTPTLNTMTVRLGNANQYVAALEEEMEAVWANKKTAQQAHEAIRPTDVRHTPERVKAHLTKD